MRRPLFVLFWLIELPLALAGALLLAFWFWSETDESLATTLQQAGKRLPTGQTLVVQDVRGSLRRGGHIGLLRWEANGLVVQARGIELAWQPLQLLNRRLQLDTLHVAELSVDDQSPSSGSGPPDEIVWPVQVDLRFAVDVLRWRGRPALEALALSGRYRFDGLRHTVALERAQIASGRYQATASMLARAPLTLDLQLLGKVQAPIGDRQLALDASATLRGPLAGPNAVLDLQARVRPDSAATGPTTATVTAQISPSAAQPILRAQASFSQLNLALVWPGAPQTLLTGTAQVQPQGQGWLAQLEFANGRAGPWDQARVPLDSAKALVQYAGGSWAIQSLSAQGAGGTVQAQGTLGTAEALGPLSGWQGQLQLQGVNPALIHSQLAPARLSGELRAKAERQALLFEAHLQPAGRQPAASPLQGLRLRNATVKGRWASGWLELQSLQLQTEDAQLLGQLDLRPADKSVRGKLQLTLPGAQVEAGGRLSANEGSGDATLQVSDAAKAARWVAALPLAPNPLAQFDLRGRAELALHWQGGWQHLVDGRGDPPTLQARARVPQLDLLAPGQPASRSLRLRDLSADASGSVNALSLGLSGELLSGSRQFALQGKAQGGRTGNGDFQFAVSPLRIQMQDSLRPGLWSLALRQTLTLDWHAEASGGSVRASMGEADLSGPLPGVATLAWQPMRWSFGEHDEFTTRGELRGIGMAWLDWFADSQFAGMGLSGNLVFDADWDLAATDTLKLRAALVRRTGDIRMLAEGIGSAAPGTVIGAGVTDARITLTAQGDAVNAALRWDSERAGSARAEFSTRLTRGSDGWDWATDAPVSATLRAQLPQVGAWSVLAPAGWRMRGTLAASLALSGTRLAPQWSGTLQADDLALRSVVDGIEFGNGRLRASMQGQRLFIDNFTMQGAGGVAVGGEVNARGSAVWVNDNGGPSPGIGSIRLDLEATARALRVSARADRRLAVSGTVQARLVDARLDIQGALKADQALFILPDESAPTLGDDVVVRQAGAASAPTVPDPERALGAERRTRVATEVSIGLDLGPDFRVRGRGLDTRIAGTLQLRAAPLTNGTPRLTGEVRTVRGSYKAYGQLLDIEHGLMRFSGPYDNPALDILAIRPNLTQRVGVQITGTVLSPRVRLYSDPELPDVEKLSWLVVGQSAASGGAEAAVLQQAALALLGGGAGGISGGLSGALGLDQLSFAGGVTNADGSTGSATVTLGKRLSRELYVAYQRSLEGTLGTLSVFYDLSKRFTLRASTGEQNAIDLIFTIRYD